MHLRLFLLATLALVSIASAEIGPISVSDAKKLIENPDAKKRPVVLDTRDGYKDVWLKSKSLPAETGGEPAGQ